jgi:hypothetical protein
MLVAWMMEKRECIGSGRYSAITARSSTHRLGIRTWIYAFDSAAVSNDCSVSRNAVIDLL